jgi:hypothetical protein
VGYKPRVSRRALVLGLLATGLLIAGCGRGGDRREVRSVVEGFYRAVDERDGEGACRLLSQETRKALEDESRKSCAQAIVDPELKFEGRRARHVEVTVSDAEVDLAGGDRVFLGRGPGGWSISAAGCQPTRPGQPFDCELEP